MKTSIAIMGLLTGAALAGTAGANHTPTAGFGAAPGKLSNTTVNSEQLETII